MALYSLVDRKSYMDSLARRSPCTGHRAMDARDWRARFTHQPPKSRANRGENAGHIVRKNALCPFKCDAPGTLGGSAHDPRLTAHTCQAACNAVGRGREILVLGLPLITGYLNSYCSTCRDGEVAPLAKEAPGL